MEWEVLYDEDFYAWLMEQLPDVRVCIVSHTNLLKQYGPSLGRPHVDTLQGSSYPNMKELRVQHRGEPWRVLFAFDPKRCAILLVAGNKQGNPRWYKENIPLADARYQRHLGKEGNNHGNSS